MNHQTVGIAMSGGVDSTIAALLLLQKGYRIHGFHMLLPLPQADVQCRRTQQIAQQLSTPLTVVDLRQTFTEQVVTPFISNYLSGLTPNPCIYCNETIKFGLLAQAMFQKGMDRIATGHYARIEDHEGSSFLARGIDRGKDQSYFLARLTAEQLQTVTFPLGSWTKDQVYKKAAGLNLHYSDKESQDVCFLHQGLSAFWAEHGLEEQPGPIVTMDGRHIGQHRGVWHYTVGQRRGLGLPDTTPWYVVRLDKQQNRIVVGKQDDLFTGRCTLRALRWTHEPPSLPWRGLVQLRSRHIPAPAELTASGTESWSLTFATPQRAVTPGQFAVLYSDNRVIGSAVIDRNDGEI
ncbi:MAG: tRNA 2-thiouridine(34) synthase MnmA [Desulfobulbus sp.]|nr:tRNA 2-thiouridine(34) synthase MnmA [Desulfobulbus sp.]